MLVFCIIKKYRVIGLTRSDQLRNKILIGSVVSVQCDAFIGRCVQPSSGLFKDAMFFLVYARLRQTCQEPFKLLPSKRVMAAA